MFHSVASLIDVILINVTVQKICILLIIYNNIKQFSCIFVSVVKCENINVKIICRLLIKYSLKVTLKKSMNLEISKRIGTVPNNFIYLFNLQSLGRSQKSIQLVDLMKFLPIEILPNFYL